MAEKIHANHARDHLPKGSDPIIGLGESGWTVTRDETEALDPSMEILIPIPRQFSGWLLYDVDASLASVSTSGDVELGLYRVRRDATTVVSVVDLLSTPITIEAAEYSSRAAAVQPVIANGIYLTNEDSSPAYDFIAISFNSVGTDAKGLMLNIAVGVERVTGSGVH